MAPQIKLSAIAIKIIASLAIGGLSLWGVRSTYVNFTKHHQQIGYDLRVGEEQAAAARKKAAEEENTDKQDKREEEGKAGQRSADTVTRSEYNDLKKEKANERLTFERLLQAAIKNSSTTVCDCANTDMPIELQRRAEPEATGSNSKED